MDEIREILSRNLYQIRQRVRIVYLAKYLPLAKAMLSGFVMSTLIPFWMSTLMPASVATYLHLSDPISLFPTCQGLTLLVGAMAKAVESPRSSTLGVGR